MKQVKVVNDNPVKQIVYWFALILFVGMILLSFAQVAGGNESKQSSSNGGSTSNSNQVKSKKLQIGIKKRPETCEKKSKKGDILHIHYRGTLEDGTEFDNSYKRGTPLTFSLGMGQVIQGWDQGLLGMCAGEKRKLVIPSDLGYGSAGAPPTIPPDATLIFEVECMKIEDRRVDL